MLEACMWTITKAAAMYTIPLAFRSELAHLFIDSTVDMLKYYVRLRRCTAMLSEIYFINREDGWSSVDITI